MSAPRVHRVADAIYSNTAECGRYLFGANVDRLMWAHDRRDVTCLACLKVSA